MLNRSDRLRIRSYFRRCIARPYRYQVIASTAVVACLHLASARADLGTSVKIGMPIDSASAEHGKPYTGVFVVDVGREGLASDFALSGEGWQFLTSPPAARRLGAASTLRIPFQAIPTDADLPIQLTLRYDGRPVTRSFKIGPAAFARRGVDRPARRVMPASAAPDAIQIEPPDDDPQPLGGAVTLRFTGRIVYLRPTGFDANDIPIFLGGTYEGVDGIWVEVMDEDPITDETIWSGYTNAAGYFDSGDILWDDCDPGCDDPDIYLRYECDTPVVNVQDATDILEPEYSWSNVANVIDDFTGSSHDFGTHTPASTNDMAALFMHNSMVRTHRFIQTKSGLGLDTPEVDVLWPEDAGNAFYNPGEISIPVSREWRDDTHSHEYGHHFLESFAQNVPPQYCNGLNFCDGVDPCTSGTNCEDPGHCRWCPETDHDAWNESFPNWLADIVTRDYPFTYVFSDGSPYEAFFTRSLENLGLCCQDGGVYGPYITQGYIGALLRDIEDGVDFDGNSLQDDHDGDGISDCMSLGYDEIFTIAAVYDVTTPLEFINSFLLEYPQHTYRLYSTAFNVHPDFTTPFPIDTNPPGVVQAVTSPSHPSGVGGDLGCITVQWDVPPDDVTGACGYSYEWSTLPAGLAPPSDEFGNYIAGSCVTLSSGPFTPGDHYISIRAKDCYNHWSTDYATFGPFTITECNGNGILDICEIPCLGLPCTDPGADPLTCCENSCDASVLATDPNRNERLACEPHPDYCSTLYLGGTCGQGSDCNTNLVPDDCDIAGGTSEDCNQDGIPDECQNMARWVGTSGSWHDPSNWDSGAVPATGQHVCIDVPGVQTVSYSTGTLDIASLSGHENLDMDDAGYHQLIIQGPSFVLGDLSIGGGSSNELRNNDTLTVSGLFSAAACWLRGGGDLIADGGMNITGFTRLFDGKDMFLANNSNASSTGTIELNANSVFEIGAGSTFEYHDDYIAFSGGNGSVVVDGTFVRTTGSGDVYVYSPADNAGLIHNQTDELVLNNGGTHTGDVLSEPGTLLGLGGATEMETTSSLVADDVELLFGTDCHIRGSVDIAGLLLVNGSTWTFTSDAVVTSYGRDLYARTGTVHFESPAAPAVDFDAVTVGEGFIYCGTPHFDTGETFVMNTLHLVCGNINGADPITINDSFTWGGGGSFFSGGAVSCNGPVTIQATSSQRNLYRVFNNTDYATFLGAVGPSGSGRFNNLATGTVELKGDNTGLSSGQSTNAGLIVKTTGTGRSTLAGMSNTGLIHAQTGEIYFYFNGENNGDILGDPGTLLTFNGTYPMTAGSSLTGDDVKFFGNTFTIDGAVDITDTLTIDGGTCTFTNQAVVTNYGQNVDALTGTFHFESPVAAPTLDFDTVTIGGGSYGAGVHFDTGQPVDIDTLNIVNGNIDGNDPITINDAFTWGGVGSFFNGGIVTCNAASTIQYSSSQRTCYRDFDNAGYATVLGAIGLSNADYTNLPAGTLDFQSDDAKFSLSSSSTLYNNGTLIKTGGTGISPIHVHFRNAGTVEVQSGALQFYGSYGLTYLQTAGQTFLNGGNLDLISNAVYELQGGALTGAGTVGGDVNNTGARVEPGASAGILTVTEDYGHGVGATLAIELGGLVAGAGHDQLVVQGQADLQGGELNVVPINGFIPQIGQQFVILTAAGGVTGVPFDTVTGPGQYSVAYNPNDVTITVVQSPPVTGIPGVSRLSLLALAGMTAAAGALTMRRRASLRPT